MTMLLQLAIYEIFLHPPPPQPQGKILRKTPYPRKQIGKGFKRNNSHRLYQEQNIALISQ